MLDLTIVGGGIQGTAIARALTAAKAIEPDRLAILDPEEEPLSNWLRLTSACGMSFLRSPSSHNLDIDFRALRRFALGRGYDPAAHFRPPYLRPSLALFNDHSHRIASSPEIAGARLRGRLLSLAPGRGWRLETDRGLLRSKLVLFAVGRTGGPAYPTWRTTGATIEHVFSPGFRRPGTGPGIRRIAVIGGGVTAGQLMLSLAEEHPSSVELVMISGGPLQVHQFDSEPCYLGPRCLESFLRVPDPEKRRRIIREVRHPGSMPPDIAASLEELVREERLEVVPEWVVGVREGSREKTLSLASGREVPASRVILATGLDPGPPAHEILQPLIRDHRLPTTADGYPIPDPTLQWAPGLVLTGPLGETEIGPGAPNIIGAHLAVRRIIPFLRSEPGVAWRPVRIATS
ncbi:MAG: hypothetical protein ACLFPV_10980 [Spirochaetaceae bacterium]